MNLQHDPVDDALETLRSEQWTAGKPFSTKLETMLMENFDTQPSRSRFHNSLFLIMALALLAVGGATFAATGGVTKLKNWFLQIEINGEVMDVQLDENGETTFDFDTEDGGVASVHIQKTNTPEDGDMTRISVIKTDDETQTVDVAKLCRKIQVGGANLVFTLEDLGDAEPVKTWTNEDGTSFALYILPAEDEPVSKLFIVTQATDEEPDVRQLATIPFSLLDLETKPTFEVDANGLLTIMLKDGEGQMQVIKLMCRKKNEKSPEDCLLRTHSGDEIRIKVDQAKADE